MLSILLFPLALLWALLDALLSWLGLKPTLSDATAPAGGPELPAAQGSSGPVPSRFSLDGTPEVTEIDSLCFAVYADVDSSCLLKLQSLVPQRALTELAGFEVPHRLDWMQVPSTNAAAVQAALLPKVHTYHAQLAARGKVVWSVFGGPDELQTSLDTFAQRAPGWHDQVQERGDFVNGCFVGREQWLFIERNDTIEVRIWVVPREHLLETVGGANQRLKQWRATLQACA